MREHLKGVAVTILVMTTIALPFALRSKSIRELHRLYEQTALGEHEQTARERLSLRMQEGPPPERYRNDVWWATAGDRKECRRWGVRPGGLLSPDYAVIVGFDAQRRVAFKAIGNT